LKDEILSEVHTELPDLKERRSWLSRHPWVSLVVLVVLMVSTYIASKILIQRIEFTGYEINPITETAFGTTQFGYYALSRITNSLFSRYLVLLSSFQVGF